MLKISAKLVKYFKSYNNLEIVRFKKKHFLRNVP